MTNRVYTAMFASVVLQNERQPYYNAVAQGDFDTMRSFLEYNFCPPSDRHAELAVHPRSSPCCTLPRVSVALLTLRRTRRSFYLRMLPYVEARTKAQFKGTKNPLTAGALYEETCTQFGMCEYLWHSSVSCLPV